MEFSSLPKLPPFSKDIRFVPLWTESLSHLVPLHVLFQLVLSPEPLGAAVRRADKLLLHVSARGKKKRSNLVPLPYSVDKSNRLTFRCGRLACSGA